MALYVCRRLAWLTVSVLLPSIVALAVTINVGCERSRQDSKAAVAADQTPPKIRPGSVFCLTTQWYPDRSTFRDESEYKLLRELVRQSVLIAAREELGMVTRDETLEEPFPAMSDTMSSDVAQGVEPLAMCVEVYGSSSWDASLYGAGATRENPVWHHQSGMGFNKRTIYSSFAKQLAEECGPIAKRLRDAGAVGEPAKPNPDNKPTAEVEKQLEAMNFVSQFAAVRAAHQAMRKQGHSLEWMGVLVRGYANLAMLTGHTWSSQTEAFAARALLYAERMCRFDNESNLAKWHRAYALAIIGADGAAIDQLEELTKTSDDGKVSLPTWRLMIGPYVKFENANLQQIGKDHPELTEIVGLLSWNQYHSYMHGRWIYEQGIATAKICPEAYGVYSVMANWNSLGIQRTGAEMGAAAFGERLPRRVATVGDAPAKGGTSGDALRGFSSNILSERDGSMLSDRPIRIAQALNAATTSEQKPSECSWAILGGLIAEEQFVEAADMMFVSQDATEHSNDELIKQLTPLVEGHRYAAYIKSFGAAPTEPQQATKILHDMKVVDPRPSMKHLFKRIWDTQLVDGKNGNELQWKGYSEHDVTRPALLGAYYGLAADWSAVIKPENRQIIAQEFRDAAPYSPNAVRLQWESQEGLTVADLTQLEPQLKEDPVGWMTLGNYYYGLKDLDASERCYKRSLEISPSYNSTVGLANTYYYKNKKDLWESTLKSYLEIDDLGLAHAQIHQQLAEQFIRDRAWSKAKPHAIAAAETYSAWGLDLASRACEGLLDWKNSEYFAAESARCYPSYASGSGWYFWCRRNGRGDLVAAREIAGPSIQLASQQTYYYEAYRTFAYRLLEGDKKRALTGLDEQISKCRDGEDVWEAVWRILNIIAVNNELKNSERRDQAITELKSHLERNIKATYPNWDEVFDGLCRGFQGQPFEEGFFAKCDQVYAGAAADYRCNLCYFLGVALDQQGQTKKADFYWRRSAFGGPFGCLSATLAGSRLVERYGAERGGTPEEFAPLETPTKKVDEENSSKDKGVEDAVVKQGESASEVEVKSEEPAEDAKAAAEDSAESQESR